MAVGTHRVSYDTSRRDRSIWELFVCQIADVRRFYTLQNQTSTRVLQKRERGTPEVGNQTLVASYSK